MKKLVLLGSGATHFKSKIPFAELVEVKRFPDGETYVRINLGVENKNVIYIQCFFPEQNKKLVESFLTIDTLRDLGARKIDLIATYLPYTRQDKRFLEGEALSLKTTIKFFKVVGVDTIFTINTHFLKEPGRYDIFGMKIVNLDATPLLVDYIKGSYKDFVVVAPDKGAKHLVENFENHIVLKKERGNYVTKESITERKVERIEGKPEIKGKNVIIIDDMISTGGTIAEACKFLKSKSIHDIDCICIHGLFVSDSIKRLKDSGINKIVVTDTIPSKFSKISVLPILSEIIRI